MFAKNRRLCHNRGMTPSSELSVPNAPQHVLQTGLRKCFDSAGNVIPCQGAFQDAAVLNGIPRPEPRFEPLGEHLVHDRLTGLIWERSAKWRIKNEFTLCGVKRDRQLHECTLAIQPCRM